ncbi:hypothetical protein [Streptomyces sp. NPDC059489]|uniref:hypothetical protein n=1 Tax=Streptomyces sp. NPDC059489 TaxID=3346849 RepID=UPI0036B5ADEA
MRRAAPAPVSSLRPAVISAHAHLLPMVVSGLGNKRLRRQAIRMKRVVSTGPSHSVRR